MIPYQSNPFQFKTEYWQNPQFLWLAVGGLFILTLVVALLVAALILPPFSLLSRLDRAYVEVGPAGNTLRDPDGARLTFLPESVTEPFRVKLTPLPRNLFLEGAVTPELLTAASSIPANLVMKSPFYRIEHRGAMPKFATISIPIPNESEPYYTLDLYTWNGESWAWLPSRVILDDEVIEGNLDYLPDSVVVMQTHPLNPQVAATYAPGQTIPDSFKNIAVEINPQGLYLEAEGLVAGQVEQLPPEILNGTFTIVPTIRNWNDDGSIRSDLIDNLLIDDAARQRHVATIVGLIQSNTFQGVELDYRGIDPIFRNEYTQLLTEVRAVLPKDKRLAVRVELPQPLSAEAWDTGAYDWPAIGRLADFVRVPALPNPKAYGPDGSMTTLLAWAVGQVSRYKLQLILQTSSVEQVGAETHFIGYQAALNSLGSVAIGGGATQLAANQPLEFTLTGLQNSGNIQFDPESGLYWLNFPGHSGGPQIIFLENAASIARKLQLVAQYNIRGIAIQNLFAADSDPRNQEVVSQFLNLALAPVEGQHAIIWQVKNKEGGVIAELIVDLTSPAYRWTTPTASGNYQITAAVSPNRTPANAIPLGSIAVVVTP
jgi:spore germination protein YaaH